MSLEISSGGINSFLPAESLSANSVNSSATKAPPPPPPPPPPPKPVQDAVELSLSANVHQLQSQGETPTQISVTLGVPLETISVDLGTYLIESTLAAAPAIPPVRSVAD